MVGDGRTKDTLFVVRHVTYADLSKSQRRAPLALPMPDERKPCDCTPTCQKPLLSRARRLHRAKIRKETESFSAAGRHSGIGT